MSKNDHKDNIFFIYAKEFFNDMRIELKSERTIETYRESLNSFRQYLTQRYGKSIDNITVSFVSEKVVREYIGWIAENYSINTRNLRLAALKSYIKYSANKNMELLPLEVGLSSLKNKKVYPKKHNWMTKEQVLLLLDQPSHTQKGIRDRFVMLFLFTTGARLNEMLQVKLKDVITESEYPYVRLMGKGSKPRIVPLSDQMFMENFKYYCTLYHSNSTPDSFLFYTVVRGVQGKMSEDNVQRILKKHGESAKNIDKTFPVVHPHLLRHSYGAQMYRLGLSLPEIAKLLGHEDISTTEIYAETDEQMLAETLSKMIGNQPVRKWDSLSDDEKLILLGLK